jgi:hypothetical protein
VQEQIQALDYCRRFAQTEGLCQKLHGTCFHCRHAHGNVPMSGDENDGNLDTQFDQFSLQLKAANPRKSHVKNEAAGAIMGGPL